MKKETARWKSMNSAEEYNETYKEKIARERRRKQRQKKRLAVLKTMMACCLIAALAASVLYLKVVKTSLSDRIVEQEQMVADLDSEYTKLKAENASSMTLAEVEEYAENELGLVRLDRSQEEYLAVEKPGQVEVNSGSNSMDKLVSNLVRSFNAILSFLH
jgi:cell division protein FtsL